MNETRHAAAGWFRECYSAHPAGAWHAPGRVNLNGEHINLNAAQGRR
jgi:galactokinase